MTDITDTKITFKLDGEKHEIDISALTLDEMIDLEDAGFPLIEPGQKMGMRTMKGIAWLALRRVRPDITLDEIGAMPLLDLISTDEPSDEPEDEPGNPT